jgi:hypothetical protein
MRPVLEHLCSVKELKDGTYDLCDIADMNDALDVRDENIFRAREAAKT